MRIVGGVVANQGSWPSIAFVSWNYKAQYRLPTGVTVTVSTGSNCGGTLIATDKVLTAGSYLKHLERKAFVHFNFKSKSFFLKLTACQTQSASHMEASFTLDPYFIQQVGIQQQVQVFQFTWAYKTERL